MNWLAVHLPALPLEVYERALQHPPPLAISEGERLIACNTAARAQGVQPGLPASAGRALLADLRVLPRNPAAEAAALARLGAWALGFSDQVSLAPPTALVLEAGRSLKLFGGADALLGRARDGLAGLGYRASCVLAPTPAGALVLAAALAASLSEGAPIAAPAIASGAKSGADSATGNPKTDARIADAPASGGLIRDRDALRRALSALPVTALGLDRREREDFARMGVKRIGDLLRLPRSGLAERFGIERVMQIERLLGERPDPRRPYRPPERFRAELELSAEVPDASALVFACRRLIDELGGFLLARQAGVQRLHWRLRHGGDMAPTRFDLGSARPERDPERWLALLRERLERLRLPAPVRAIALASEAPRPLAPASGELFADRAAAIEPDPALLDRLCARLGSDAVRGLLLLPDHRPERAWRWCGAGERSTDKVSGRLARPDRPLWLLPVPVPLALRDRRPWLDGPLDLGQGCERIETGWWDDFEIARDYYVATTVQGERLWIYREMYGARGWFLHGLFGSDPRV